MAGRDDLVNGFSRLVLKEANEKRQSILEEIEKSKQELLKEKESLFLEKAYIKVQEAVRETKKIRNEDYSKAVLDSKKNLLLRRAAIMDEVFSNVNKRFEKFRNSEKYKQWLEKLIIEGMEKIDAKEYEIMCEKQDEKLIKDIIKKLKIKAKIIEFLEDIQGGIIIESIAKATLIDLTVKEMQKEARAEFLSYSGLSVNRW